MRKKHVKIIHKIAINYKQGYKNTQKIKIKPDSIWIFGARAVIDKIDEVSTKPINFENVMSGFSKSVLLDFPKDVKSNTKEVFCHVEVDQFVETETKIELKLINVPDSIDIVLFPKNAIVKYKVFYTDFEKSKAVFLKVVLDYNKRDSVLYPKLLQLPKFIFDANVYPNKIAFLTKIK
jgi:YbbR domain-containing protein